MSSLKAGKIQSGISITPANNMVFDASADNGTFTFKREDGSVLFTVDATGKIDMDGTGVFQKDNILGTVSQTAGVPTGDIFESGSNANGVYAKYANGTLLMHKGAASTANVAINTNAAFNYTYPSTPVGAGVVSFQILPSGNYEWEVQSSVNAGAYGAITIFNGPTAIQSFSIGFMFIGRWF